MSTAGEDEHADRATTEPMGYRFLGKGTGLAVSELCLGLMTLSTTGKGPWGIPAADQETSLRLLDQYVAAGGNFLDTADVYGSSEELLGRWLAREGTQRRDQLVIATKVRGSTGRGVNDVGLSRKHIVDSLQRSLERIGTDRIDLLQIHSPDPRTSLQETMRTLHDLVRSGKVHHIGLSNYPAWMVQKAIGIAERMGWERTNICNMQLMTWACELSYSLYVAIVSIQPQYSLLCRSTEWDLIPLALEEGLAVLPWSPLKVLTQICPPECSMLMESGCQGGWLAGKKELTKDRPAAGSRVEWAEEAGWQEGGFSYFNNAHTWEVLDTVAEVAWKAKKSSAQVSLRWLLQKPGVTSVLIGARTEAQLEDNLGAVGWTLSDEDMEALNHASAQAPLYPWQPIRDRWPSSH